jgi:uncharacterized protein YdeI (YjbR/CyaY-like superfamily)
MKPTFFATPTEFRAWLETRHDTSRELWVGFHKKSSGQASITWPEAVDEALCVGWIDGQRKGIDDVDSAIRFTPRKPGSIWSALRDRSGVYSYEQPKAAELDEAQLREFHANRKAWEFF